MIHGTLFNMNDVQGVLHMLDLKSCSIVAVYQLDHGLVCRDEDGLQREKQSTYSFDPLSCKSKAKRPENKIPCHQGKTSAQSILFLDCQLEV